VSLNLSSEYVYPQTPAKDENFNRTGGLTKREHFAGLAMQGLLSNLRNAQTTTSELCATASVEAADALIAELEKPKP
jgi:hypothetical protein